LSIQAAEAAVHPNYPVCEALLLIELDGPKAEVDLQMAAVITLAKNNGAWETRLAIDAQDRALIWKGRKAAFAAAGRLSSHYIVQDGVIPRTTLPTVLDKIATMAAAENLRVTNVFHAGDGNLHPIVLYRAENPGEEARAIDLSMRILEVCVDAGGSITGEHGVGREKQCSMSYMYATPDLETMQRVRHAFDPHNIANPEKLFPTPRLCGERSRGAYVPHNLETSGIAEIF
jgi:glycolate oxidase